MDGPVLLRRFVGRLSYEDGGCLNWTGPLHRKGYAHVWVDGGKKYLHRVVYESLVGPIPEGLTIDHTCCNKTCQNVHHMQVVSSASNAALRHTRKTHCKHGHEYTPENTYYRASRPGSKPHRRCHECQKQQNAKSMMSYYARRTQGDN